MKTGEVGTSRVGTPMVRTNRGGKSAIVKAAGKTGIAKGISKSASKKVVIFVEGDMDLEFFEALRARMAAIGLTQQELAARLKISQQRVSTTLSGRHPPNLETIARFAAAMDCVVECCFRDSSTRK